MITQDQLKEIAIRLDALYGYLEIEAKKMQIEEEDLKTQDPDFWTKPKEAEALLKKLKHKKFWVAAYQSVRDECEDLEVLFDFCKEGEATEEEVQETYDALLTRVEELEFKNILSAE